MRLSFLRPAAFLLLVAATGSAASLARAESYPKIYYDVEVEETYVSYQADGSMWESAANVHATYMTQGPGGQPVQPKTVAGTFAARLVGRGPGHATSCAYTGKPGGGHQLAVLEWGNGAQVQWPGYPGMWDQTRTRATTANCPTTFGLNPLEGDTIWREAEYYFDPFNKPWTSSKNPATAAHYFQYALIGGIGLYPPKENEERAMEMESRLSYGGGEIYITKGVGAAIISAKPVTKKISLPQLPFSDTPPAGDGKDMPKLAPWR